MKKIVEENGIIIKGHIGTWYVIGAEVRDGKNLYLLEHEEYGDEAQSLIVDADLNIVLDDIWNGFDDYDEYINNLE